MKKMLPVSLMALLISAVVVHGALEAAPQKFGGGRGTLPKGGVAINKGVGINQGIINKGPGIINNGPGIVNKGNTPIFVDTKKKSGIGIGTIKDGLPDLTKKKGIGSDVINKGISINDIVKKGPSIVNKGISINDIVKKGPTTTGKNVTKSEMFCYPPKQFCGTYPGCWYPKCPPCGGCWFPCYYPPCPPPCYGWFPCWYPTVVVMDPIIVETPIVPGPVTGPTGPTTEVVPPVAGDSKVQTKRFLKLKNDSGEKLTVFVQYIVRTDDGDSLWMPGEPESEKALTFEMEVGQELFVEAKGKKMATGVVRIWAVSPKGKFEEFKVKDLRLVPEQDAQGNYSYLAPDIMTFTLTWPPVQETSLAPTTATRKELVSVL